MQICLIILLLCIKYVFTNCVNYKENSLKIKNYCENLCTFDPYKLSNNFTMCTCLKLNDLTSQTYFLNFNYLTLTADKLLRCTNLQSDIQQNVNKIVYNNYFDLDICTKKLISVSSMNMKVNNLEDARTMCNNICSNSYINYNNCYILSLDFLNDRINCNCFTDNLEVEHTIELWVNMSNSKDLDYIQTENDVFIDFNQNCSKCVENYASLASYNWCKIIKNNSNEICYWLNLEEQISNCIIMPFKIVYKINFAKLFHEFMDGKIKSYIGQVVNDQNFNICKNKNFQKKYFTFSENLESKMNTNVFFTFSNLTSFQSELINKTKQLTNLYKNKNCKQTCYTECYFTMNDGNCFCLNITILDYDHLFNIYYHLDNFNNKTQNLFNHSNLMHSIDFNDKCFSIFHIYLLIKCREVCKFKKDFCYTVDNDNRCICNNVLGQKYVADDFLFNTTKNHVIKNVEELSKCLNVHTKEEINSFLNLKKITKNIDVWKYEHND